MRGTRQRGELDKGFYGTYLTFSAKGIEENNYDSTFNESIFKTSKKAFNNPEFEEILLSSSKSSASKSKSATSIDKSKDKNILGDYKNSNELLNDLLANREHFEEILKKWMIHFKGNEKHEIISFIKTFHNLVTQHVGKHLKTKPVDLFSNLLSSAVMLMLVKIGVLEGDVIKFLCESQMWTLNKLATSTSVNINLEKLKIYLTKNNLQKVITKPALKTLYELNGDIENYTHIWFYMIEEAIKWNFFRNKNEPTSIGKLKNLMGFILFGYRKSNGCTANIKEFITKEKDLKYLTVNVFKKLGLFEEGTEKLIFNDHEIDNIMIDYKRKPEKLEEQLKQKVKEIIEENKSPT